MKHRELTRLALAMALSSLLGSAHAQTQRSGGGGEAQKFMQQYQQLAGEKTALQTQLEQAKKELDKANAALATITKERDALKLRPAGAPASEVQKITSAKDSAERNLEQSKLRMTTLAGQFREMANNLKEIEVDRARVRTELQSRDAAFDKCADNNQQLYDINGDILNRYNHVGLFTKVSASEPFTQITHTRLDNLVVETRERAEQLRIKKRTPPH